MWLTLYIGATPSRGVNLPFVKWPVAGTGDKRTGDQRLAALHSFEQGSLEALADSLQRQRDEDVHTALDNADADDEQTALILYWLSGGF